MITRRPPASALKFAVFSAITVLLMVALASLIGNITTRDSQTYTAQFTDATGVYPGDTVRLSGVEVGSVSGVRIVEAGQQRLAEVEFTVGSEVPLYRSARLEMRYQNLLGRRYLAVAEQPGGGATMPPGATFGPQQTKPALNLTTLFNGFRPLFQVLQPDQVNQLALNVVQTLQGESGAIGQLLGNTARLTSTLAGKDAVIGQVVNNLTAVLTTVDQRDEKLTALIDRFRDLMRGVASNREDINAGLPSLASLLGSANGLVEQARPPLRADIGQLHTLAGQLADTKGTLEQQLQALPGRMSDVTRTASHGAWFNFYLCNLDANVSLLGHAMRLEEPASVSANERDTVCSQGKGVR